MPFAPESKASGIENRGFHAVSWSQREFAVSAEGGRVLQHFGAVDYDARVWIDEHLVAGHEGDHTPFCVDITDVLDTSGRQTVTVRVEDDPIDLANPRGKQDWQLEPHSIW